MAVSMQHHPHNPQQQGQAASHIQPHPRPSSIVQQHHPHAPPQQPQHSSPYSYQHQHPQQPAQTSGAQHAQDIPYYTQQSPYSTPGATSGYTSAGESPLAGWIWLHGGLGFEPRHTARLSVLWS